MCKLYGNPVFCWLNRIHTIVCQQKQTYTLTHARINWEFARWCNSTIDIYSCSFLNHKKTIKIHSLSLFLSPSAVHMQTDTVRQQKQQVQRIEEMLEATNEIETTNSIWIVCIVVVVAFCRWYSCCHCCGCCYCCFIGYHTHTERVKKRLTHKKTIHFQLCRKCTEGICTLMEFR